MRISLDYYRILGLPLTASDEQLRQAYSDRRQQLPRREYSQTAIVSRKKLIEEAYVVLSDPKERRAYDQLYLAHAYGSEGDGVAVAVENGSSQNNGEIDAQSLSIEIAQDELVGALLILQDLGEYELVMKLGHPYIVSKNGASDPNSDTNVERSDVVLTVALACLELGREQWQQGNYENAAMSLETGAELLAREELFPNVQAEIRADLDRLRPYRILELLAQPEEKTAERSFGLQLLEDILEERGGIDGTLNDRSGLNIDDFLRFIQQLRNYLTAAEQQKLFEEQSKNRFSAVATYLAVYALIARGFSQRQPALIRQAKQMLIRLGKRQDVHLEQSLCALLLGQTEEATRALELSQEYEALAFIREKSQDSPDLLPGLCLYVERWLENEVFSHFRDLTNQPALLKDYFADQQVQAYLEVLPTQTEINNESTGINRQSSSQTTTSRPRSNSSPYRQFQQNTTPENGEQEIQTRTEPQASNYSPSKFATPPTAANSWRTKKETPVGSFASAEQNHNLNGKPNTSVPSTAPNSKRRKRSPTVSAGRVSPTNYGSAYRRRGLKSNPQAKMRLLLVMFGSVAGLLVFWLVVTTTFGWVKSLFSPAPSLQGEQLLVQLDQPPIPIPDSNSKPAFPDGPLTETTAEEVIQTWLATKAAALGPNHDIASLEQILVGTALTQWQRIAQENKAANHYRKYEHTLKVESLDTSPSDADRAGVEATVNEVTQFYENGQIKKSGNDKIRVRYVLVRVNGAWRIRDMSVVNKIS